MITVIVIALCVLAVCDILRTAYILGSANYQKTVNNAFIDSLKKDNKEWAEELLTEFLEADKEKPDSSAGVWNPTKEANLWKCSNCGVVIYSETERDITFNHAYCGRCGAEMKPFNGGGES